MRRPVRMAALTMFPMATNPERDPDREEFEAVLAANPGLREHLDALVDQYLRGELVVVDHARVGRILEQVIGQCLEPD